MNIDAPWPPTQVAAARVLEMQTKLHQWAGENQDRRFDDLFNLVCDPAFLVTAWQRVRGNRGARTAGVDGQTAHHIEQVRGVETFLADLRASLRGRAYTPIPVRERMIPKADGRFRRLGIPATRDRVVQAAVKLVLEPIFEAGFRPCSYGFRAHRSAHDAIAEIHFFGNRTYDWVLEGDIEACFDSIDHTALMGRVRRRIGDRRLLALIKAFLKTGILTETGREEETTTGTPQGGILSPLLANIALSVLDNHFGGMWETQMSTSTRRQVRQRKGLGNWRLIRYADDFVIMVSGSRANAEALQAEVGAVLAPMGLRLSVAKTRVVHLDEGFDFLGYRVQRRRKRGSQQRHIYTYPSRKAIRAVWRAVRGLTRRSSGATPWLLLRHLNAVVRGWCTYFRHGASKRMFSKLSSFVWQRVTRWLRQRHRRMSWRQLRRRYMRGWDIIADRMMLFKASSVAIVRYRYRGNAIPAPWPTAVLVSSMA